MRQFNTLTGFLTSKSSSPTANDTVEFQGYDAVGDGGSATWQHNGVTGQTPSQSPAQLGDALLNDGDGNQWALVVQGVVDARVTGVSTTNTPEQNTYAAQALVNGLILGGEIEFNESYQFKAIYDLDRTSLPAGYVPNDEMRRANKTLIIYKAEGLTIGGVGTLDRSGDDAIDSEYSEYSSTIYISQSNNIKVKNIKLVGYQVDTDILNDIKTNTSGDNININNGSSNITVENVTCKDGTNGVSVANNRTSSSQSIDPNLLDCTDITLTGITVENCEHFLILLACDGVNITNFYGTTTKRENGVLGVTQRGIYLHSARNVKGRNINVKGMFKVGLNISDYRDVYGIKLSGFSATEFLSGAEYSNLTGDNYNLNFNSIGFRLAGINENLYSDITLDDFTVSGCATSVTSNTTNYTDVTYSNWVASSAYSGFRSIDYRSSSVVDNPPVGLVFDNVNFKVINDPINFPAAITVSGIHLTNDSLLGNGKMKMSNVTVESNNRNCRVTSFDGLVVNSTFKYISGLAGSRAYDGNFSLGDIKLINNDFLTEGRPNKGSDTPATSDTLGISVSSGNGYQTIPTSATPLLEREVAYQLTSDTSLTIKVKGTDGAVRSVNLVLT